jgi:hypothetical protein
MPTNYSGNPGNVTTPLSRTITNCQSGAGNLVEVTTSVAHLYGTYDYVTISGVVGTVEANTTAPITVVDSTKFLLDGVLFTNSYSSGGIVTDISLTPYGQLPSDGEALTVNSIEAFLQMLADRTQYLATQNSSVIGVQTVTATTTVTPPAGAHFALVEGCGGGGGGAGGGQAANATNSYAVGGGGGGGAIGRTQCLPVDDSTSYTLTIGAGGAAGAGGATPSDGSDGGDTSFGSLATWRGAAGGFTKVRSAATNLVGWGGVAVRSNASQMIGNPGSAAPGEQARQAGQGGLGMSNVTVLGGDGMASPQGYAGGAQGASGGSDDGTHRGGGPGGGGGAGPKGAGGAGGVGGNANAGGTGVAGGAGTAPAANTGAGGSGGGGGGAGGGAGGAGGAGRAGADGYMTITWMR